MPKFLSNIIKNHREFWSRENIFLLLTGVLFFLFALLVQHIAYNYIDYRIHVQGVGDLLLDNLPSVNLTFFILQGALLLTACILVLFLVKPKYLPFSLKSLALFLIVRSFFISLTHLGANLNQLQLNTNSVGFGLYDFLYNAKNDYFFSGHVGAPFLFALIFWKEKFWRYAFFITAAVFGVSMLLNHMHYSIDVFAAPFITYSIFCIAKRVFKKDFKLIS